MAHRITLIPGDGTGPEITVAAIGPANRRLFPRYKATRSVAIPLPWACAHG